MKIKLFILAAAVLVIAGLSSSIKTVQLSETSVCKDNGSLQLSLDFSYDASAKAIDLCSGSDWTDVSSVLLLLMQDTVVIQSIDVTSQVVGSLTHAVYVSNIDSGQYDAYIIANLDSSQSKTASDYRHGSLPRGTFSLPYLETTSTKLEVSSPVYATAPNYFVAKIQGIEITDSETTYEAASLESV